jgi:hypothetical protein
MGGIQETESSPQCNGIPRGAAPRFSLHCNKGRDAFGSFFISLCVEFCPPGTGTIGFVFAAPKTEQGEDRRSRVPRTLGR